ncbi:hypothetical protein Taro_001051 [Colocasia esculenta]|uniref:Uncharacterized protein n=1 Tax=Colocasia esculenta TaxID=4460 RepID=A0A843TI17_COLES|nr:hypothetical protein [Colocasia esculenta]
MRVATGSGQIATRACTERDRLFRIGAKIATGSCKDRDRLVMTDARIATAVPVAFRMTLCDVEGTLLAIVLDFIRVYGSTKPRWVQTSKVTMQITCNDTISPALGSLHNCARQFLDGAEIATGSCKDSDRLVMTDAWIATIFPVAFRTRRVMLS